MSKKDDLLVWRVQWSGDEHFAPQNFEDFCDYDQAKEEAYKQSASWTYVAVSKVYGVITSSTIVFEIKTPVMKSK